MIRSLLLVGAGGALGSVARYAVSMLFAHYAICNHWATMLVNIIGSFFDWSSHPVAFKWRTSLCRSRFLWWFYNFLDILVPGSATVPDG